MSKRQHLSHLIQSWSGNLNTMNTGDSQADAARKALFAGTASYYAKYRPRYPSDVLDLAIERLGIQPRGRVLDLGCGTGQIAIPLAARGLDVFAVDPDSEMLLHGVHASHLEAADGGHPSIWWRLGSDKDLPALRLPTLDACFMGASFHWMDRDAAVASLSTMLGDAAGIALLSGFGSVWSESDDDWSEIVREVIVEFLGPQRRAGTGSYEHPKEGHADILGRSAFSSVDTVELTTEMELTAEDIVGLQLSTSYASPQLLGERLDDFRGKIIRRLATVQPSGVHRFPRRTELILGRRG